MKEMDAAVTAMYWNLWPSFPYIALSKNALRVCVCVFVRVLQGVFQAQAQRIDKCIRTTAIEAMMLRVNKIRFVKFVLSKHTKHLVEKIRK